MFYVKHFTEKSSVNTIIKSILFAFLLLIYLFLLLARTTAHLLTQDESIENVFSTTEVTCQVIAPESTDITGAALNIGRVVNTGETDAFVRAMVLATWQDADGSIYPVLPAEGTDGDYLLDMNLSNGWLQGFGRILLLQQSHLSRKANERPHPCP